ncbi:hypothetical protein VTK56DRAFT_2004 [Thermocarpiscus australiensis]
MNIQHLTRRGLQSDLCFKHGADTSQVALTPMPRLPNDSATPTSPRRRDMSTAIVKFHFKSNQCNDTPTDAEAHRLAGEDPDNHKADLGCTMPSKQATSLLVVTGSRDGVSYRSQA